MRIGDPELVLDEVRRVLGLADVARAAASARVRTMREWLKVPKAFDWMSCRASWLRSVSSRILRVVVMSNSDSKKGRAARATRADTRPPAKAHPTF